MNAAPLWAQALQALLLLASAALVLAASWALARMDDFFQRLHPPALGYTLGAWCVCLACIVHFAAQEGELQWRFLLIAMLLAITAPITSILLARAALFRGRRSPARRKLPPALRPQAAAESAADAPEIAALEPAPAPAAPEGEAAPVQQDAAAAASSENTSG